jgi:hypothetical protein
MPVKKYGEAWKMKRTTPRIVAERYKEYAGEMMSSIAASTWTVTAVRAVE